MLTVLHLRGQVSKDGKLEVELPPDFPSGPVQVTIFFHDQGWEDQPWTEEELQLMMTTLPTNGAAIAQSTALVGAWKDQGISDSVEWVEKIRRGKEEQSPR